MQKEFGKPLMMPQQPLEEAIASVIHSQKYTIAWIDSKGQINQISTPMGLGEQALIVKVIEKSFFDILDPRPKE